MKLQKSKESSNWKTDSQFHNCQSVVTKDDVSNQNFESFYKKQYSIIASKYTFLTSQQLRKRILNMWKNMTHNSPKLKRLEKNKNTLKQRNRCESDSKKLGTNIQSPKNKILIPLEVNVVPAAKKGVLKGSNLENESTKDNKHVSFNSDTEIHYRTASEDSSISHLPNKSIGKYTNMNKDIDTGFNGQQNFRSYVNGKVQKHAKKLETETQFDILLNEKCSWSYKSLTTVNNYNIEKNQVNKHSFLQAQRSKTSVCLVENGETNYLDVPSTTETRKLKCSDESFEINSLNTIKTKKDNYENNGGSYDYDEFDQFKNKKSKKIVKKTNNSEVKSKPKASRSLRNKKCINYSELDLNDVVVPHENISNNSTIKVNKSIEINSELSEDCYSNYSDEGLIFQTRFSDKNVNVIDITNSIESYSNESCEILQERNKQCVTTTPLILKLESKNNDESKRNANMPPIIPSDNKWKNSSCKEFDNGSLSENLDCKKKNTDVFDKVYKCDEKSSQKGCMNIEMCNSDVDIDLEAEIIKQCDTICTEINSVYKDLETAKHSLDNNSKNDTSSESTNYENSNNYFSDQESEDIMQTIINNGCQDNENMSNKGENKIDMSELSEKNKSKIKTGTNVFVNDKKQIVRTHPKSHEEIASPQFQEEDKSILKKNSDKVKTNPVKSHLIKSTLRNNKNLMILNTKYELSNTNTRDHDNDYKVSKNEMNKNFIFSEEHKSNAEFEKLFTKSFTSKMNLNIHSDTEDYLHETEKNYSKKKQKTESVSNTTRNNNNLNTICNSDNLENTLIYDNQNLCEVNTMLTSHSEEEENILQSLKRNARNSLHSKETLNFRNERKNNSPIKKQCLPKHNKDSMNKQNKLLITDETEKESFPNKRKLNEVHFAVIETTQGPTGIEIPNKNMHLEKPKTWEELEATLLSDKDNSLEGLVFKTEETYTSLEINHNPKETKKNIKRISKYWKQKGNLKIGNTDDFVNKEAEITNNKYGLTENSVNVLKNNNCYKSPDFNQLPVADSPNLSIVNKALAAMERCTAGYLSTNQGKFQNGWIKYDKNYVSSDCNFIVQKFESTYIHTSGNKLCITEEANNYAQDSEAINTKNKTKKQLNLKKYSSKRKIKPFIAETLNSKPTVTSKSITNKNKLSIAKSEKTGKLRKIHYKNEKCSKALKNTTQFNFDSNEGDIPNKFQENTNSEENAFIVLENCDFEIEDGSELGSAIESSSAENSQNSQVSSAFINNVENRYHLRKRKHVLTSETKDKKILKEKKLKSERQNKNYDHNSKLYGKLLNNPSKTIKQSKILSQDNNFEELKMDICDTKTNKRCITNESVCKIYKDTSDSFNTNTSENNTLNVEFKQIKLHDKKSNKTCTTDTNAKLTKPKKFYKKASKVNQITDENPESSEKEQRFEINTVPFKKKKMNKIKKTKDDYVKYLKNLFQNYENNKDSEKEFITKSDGDLFSISSDESEFDETGYHSEVTQSQLSNLFHDILDEKEI